MSSPPPSDAQREKRARRPPVSFVAGPASSRLQDVVRDREMEEARRIATAAAGALQGRGASPSPAPERSAATARAPRGDGPAASRLGSEPRQSSVTTQTATSRQPAARSAAAKTGVSRGSQGRTGMAADDEEPMQRRKTSAATRGTPAELSSKAEVPKTTTVAEIPAAPARGLSSAAELQASKPADVSIQRGLQVVEASAQVPRAMERTSDGSAADGGNTTGGAAVQETDEQLAMRLHLEQEEGQLRRVRRPPPVFVAGPASGRKDILLQVRVSQ